MASPTLLANPPTPPPLLSILSTPLKLRPKSKDSIYEGEYNLSLKLGLSHSKCTVTTVEQAASGIMQSFAAFTLEFTRIYLVRKS